MAGTFRPEFEVPHFVCVGLAQAQRIAVAVHPICCVGGTDIDGFSGYVLGLLRSAHPLGCFFARSVRADSGVQQFLLIADRTPSRG